MLTCCFNADSLHAYTGLKRLESGAFVKDYEDVDKEIEQAVQMCLTEVVSEDPRYLEREAPPLSEEFPEGSKIFFLGEHAYGVAAQVSSTTDSTLSVILAVSYMFVEVACSASDVSMSLVLPLRESGE